MHIESRTSRDREAGSDIYVDVETRGGPESLEALTAALRQHCTKVDVHRIERPSRGMKKTTSLDKGSTKCKQHHCCLTAVTPCRIELFSLFMGWEFMGTPKPTVFLTVPTLYS